MARIIHPENFDGQRELLRQIKIKSDAGGSVILAPLFAEKKINLLDDITNGTNASTHNAGMKLLHRQAENYVQIRDVKFAHVFLHARGEIQFLKSLFKPNVRQLGDWGVTVDDTSRISYTSEFDKQVKLVKAIKTKHESYSSGTSPLQSYLVEQSINLGADLVLTTDAETAEANSQKTRRDAEEEKQIRDNLWNPVDKHLRYIGDFLMKLFRGKEKKAGEYGFIIDDSPRAPKERISKIKPSSQITIKGIVIGSTLTNIGTTPIHIYKGTSTAGTPAIVPPNEMMGMIKGYSVITVINPSTLEMAKIKTLLVR
ncbi:MAG: hypothetical protein V1781_05360 [Bacteroidota bacterium]